MGKLPYTEILLVRHGATRANEQQPPVLQGNAVDHPLSDLGRRQAAQVSDLLASKSIVAVYASAMRRAIETAEMIALPHGLAVNTRATLHEIDVGDWEALTWPQIAAKHPEHYAAFRDPERDAPYLGGESFTEVWQRVSPVFEDLRIRHAGARIVVVAHKGVNRAVLTAILGLPMARASVLPQDNCCVTVLRLRESGACVGNSNSAFYLR